MRAPLMAVVGGVAVAQAVFTVVWVALIVTGNGTASLAWGVMSIVLGVVMTIVTVFLAWMILEALGRIERETDRVQQFMDNVYRRLP